MKWKVNKTYDWTGWYTVFVTINVFVKPGSKKEPLVDESSDRLTIYLKEKAIDGSANTTLQKVLSRYYKVPKTKINIKSGLASRYKIVEIHDESWYVT